jgi:hypothetical protein
VARNVLHPVVYFVGQWSGDIPWLFRRPIPIGIFQEIAIKTGHQYRFGWFKEPGVFDFFLNLLRHPKKAATWLWYRNNPIPQVPVHQSWFFNSGWRCAPYRGIFLNKISGVGTFFGLLIHVFPGTNKQRARQPSIVLSWIWRQNKTPGRLVRSRYWIYKFIFWWFAVPIWPVR